jgi:uncharacterized protein YcbX
MFLSGLFIYPIKSLKGIQVAESRVERAGLEYDRRWMLVDSNNRFISQRDYPKLATISVGIETSHLTVSARGHDPLLIPFQTPTDFPILVQVWADTCAGSLVSREADQWFSKVLEEPCRLVHVGANVQRRVDQKYAIADDIVSFADAYPFLLANNASLDELNSRLPERIVMNRFRPNFVISGAPSFAEDDWKFITIGSASFHVVKPCSRCVMTTIDQETGAKNGDEPLRTLASFRRRGNEVHFGQNLIAADEGETVRLGDPLTIIETTAGALHQA